jgi:hypothetical protein
MVMEEIRCGETGCSESISTQNIIEMANLTGGPMTGLFPDPRTYRCPAGHRTTLKDDVAHFIATLPRLSKRIEDDPDTPPGGVN